MGSDGGSGRQPGSVRRQRPPDLPLRHTRATDVEHGAERPAEPRSEASQSPPSLGGGARQLSVDRQHNTYVAPAVGSLPLDKIRALDLDRFYARVRAGGSGTGGELLPRAVRLCHTRS